MQDSFSLIQIFWLTACFFQCFEYEIPLRCLWTREVSGRKLAINLIEGPFSLMSIFFCFNIVFLCLVFDRLTIIGPAVYPFKFILLGVHRTSWICRLMIYSNLGNFGPLFLQISFCSFSLSFWDSHYMCVSVLNGAPQISEALFIFFLNSFFFLSVPQNGSSQFT